MGHLPPSTALFTIIAAMVLDFAISHSKQRPQFQIFGTQLALTEHA